MPEAAAKHTALLLAGSRPGRDAFAQGHGVPLKALIRVGGEPMVRRPLRALLAAAAIGDVVVLTQAPDAIGRVLSSDPRLRLQPSAGTIAETLLEIISGDAVEWPVLVTTADHALLDAATIDEFCSAAAGSDLAVGVVERAALERRLPQTRRTWLKFRGGAFTGANLFHLGSPAVAPAIAMWRTVEQDRKKGWRLVSLLGPLTLAGAALRLLTIDAVLARLGRKLRLKMRAVRLSNPLAGVDVDKPEDHRLVEAIIAGKA